MNRRDAGDAAMKGASKSWSWWAVLWLVGVTVACFLVFDVLDLDESQLRNTIPGGIVAADTVDAEMERVSHLAGRLPMVPDGDRAPRRLLAQANAVVTCCTTMPVVLRAHVVPVRLHRRKDLTSETPASDAGDPA